MPTLTISEFNTLTDRVIGIAINIHKQLGPGFAEKVYQRIMYLELTKTDLDIKREYKITVYWNKTVVGYHVIDFLIAEELLVELKATGETQDIRKFQLLSYLKAADIRLGLLLNFGSPVLGIKRAVNKL